MTPVDEARRARLRALRQGSTDIVVPAAVLAEGVFNGNPGHDYHVRRLLDSVDIPALERTTGIAAGAMRQAAIAGGTEPAPSGVDAIVVAEADARGSREDVVIVTSDGGDFEVLGSLAQNAKRLTVLVV